MWHCPHCGAPQAETARCWVCRKSSTTCSTCRHFQTSLTADVGWCGLDRKRQPLTGLEQRGCWQQRPVTLPAPSMAPGVRTGRRPRKRHVSDQGEPMAPPLDFVPVELIGHRVIAGEPPPSTAVIGEIDLPPMPLRMAEPEGSWGERTSLFGEPDA